MKTYRKPTGERIAAAILDSIFLSIVTTILMALYMLLTLDFENVLDSLIANTSYGQDGYNNFLVFSSLVGLIFGTLYFVIIPWKWNGQTLGKKILKIKAIDEYGENPSLFQHFVRGIQNWESYFGILAIIGALTTMDPFIFILAGVGFVIQAVIIVALILVVSREDGKGLHDLMANTSVVRVDVDLNEQFTMKTAQMSDWAEIVDEDDRGFKEIKEIQEDEEKDDWGF